MFLINYVKL